MRVNSCACRRFSYTVGEPHFIEWPNPQQQRRIFDHSISRETVSFYKLVRISRHLATFGSPGRRREENTSDVDNISD